MTSTFIKTLETTQQNIAFIAGKYNDSKRYQKFFKIFEALECFDVSLLQNGDWDIYYDNRIQPLAGRYHMENQEIVLPLMLLYTNFSYYQLQAKTYIAEEDYKKLLIEKQQFGKAIREICVHDFKERLITPEKVQKVVDFLTWAKPQLYHICGQIGEYSEEVVPHEADSLKEIRKIYESFKVDNDSIYFYDEILEKHSSVPIDSSEAGYAISMLFCQAYAVSIPWLKEYDPSEQWCPLVPWNIILHFRVLYTNLF